jgi:hypothetical protein
LVNKLPRFSQNSFEKGQEATYRFKKEICANLRNLSNKKKGISLGGFEKLLVNSKTFGVKRIRLSNSI